MATTEGAAPAGLVQTPRMTTGYSRIHYLQSVLILFTKSAEETKFWVHQA